MPREWTKEKEKEEEEEKEKEKEEEEEKERERERRKRSFPHFFSLLPSTVTSNVEEKKKK